MSALSPETPPAPTSPPIAPYLWLLLPPLFWASNIVVGRGIIQEFSPVSLTFLRWIVGAALLTALSWRQLLAARYVIKTEWRLLAVYSLTAVGGINVLVYYALNHTTAVNVSIVNAALPILIVIASRVGLGEKLSRRQALGVAVSFIGVMVVISRGHLTTLLTLHINVGDLFMLLGVSCWAIYSVLLRRCGTRLSGLPFAAVIGWLGAFMALPWFLIEAASGLSLPREPELWAAVLYIGIFPSALALLIWNRGIGQVGINMAGFFTYLTPVYGSTMAVLFLGETFETFHLVGVTLIFGGVYLAVRGRRVVSTPASV